MNRRAFSLVCIPLLLIWVGTCRNEPSLATRHDLPLGSLKNLDGLTEAEVISRLGSPDTRYDFSMSRAQDESHTRLERFFPMPGNRDVVIREFNWNGSDFVTNVWFQQISNTWRVFDTRWYGMDVIF